MLKFRFYLLALVTAIFIFSFASAAVEIGLPIRQGTCGTLAQGGNYSSCVVKSLQFPDQQIQITDYEMTKTGAYFNYSNFCDTSQIGKLIVNTECDGQLFPYSIPITWTGLEEQQERTILFWVYTLAIVLSLVLVIMAWKAEMTWLGFLAGILATLPGITMMIHGFGFVETTLIRGVAAIFIVLGILTMVSFAFEYEHFFGSRDVFGQDNSEEKTKDEYDYYENPD